MMDPPDGQRIPGKFITEFVKYLKKIRLRLFEPQDISSLSQPEVDFPVSSYDFVFNVIESRRMRRSREIAEIGSSAMPNVSVLVSPPSILDRAASVLGLLLLLRFCDARFD